MIRRKSASKSIATSTTDAKALPWLPARRGFILTILCCTAVAWLAGPAGHLLILLPFLLLGPGYLLERFLRPFAQPTPFLRLSMWVGLSLSAIALLYEWATTLGLSLPLPALALLAVACALGCIARLWRGNANHSEARIHIDGWGLALAAVIILTVWTRISEVRALVLPNWVDSVHHALLIRVAAERGLVPLDLRPYLPIVELPYHWGYHVFVATLMQLAQVDLPAAMLWSGQTLNVLQSVAAAGLAGYLWRRPAAGVAAAIVVGLVSIMPAYYVSWGRYTQLTGLLLVTPIAACWLELLRKPSRRLVATLAILLAGLSLIHFIVLLFTLMFLAVSGFLWLLRAKGVELRAGMLGAAAAAALALGMTLPWMLVLVRQKLATTPQGSALPLVGGGTFNALDMNLLWAGQNRLLIAGALLAALWGIRRHQRGALEQIGWVVAMVASANPWLALYVLPVAGSSLALWAALRRRWLLMLPGLVCVLANPSLLRLPYLSLLTNEAVVISLFLPMGVLIGGAAAWGWDALAGPSRAWARSLAILLVAAAATWGGWNLRDVVNPSTVLVGAGDVAALEWAAANTPADARFLVNTTGWLRTGRGSDAGWWLLPLAGRWVSAPPVIYDYAPPAFADAARARNAVVSRFKAGNENELYALIDHERITYVFLGTHGGPLSAAAFPASAGFEKVYERDGAAIFAVRRAK